MRVLNRSMLGRGVGPPLVLVLVFAATACSFTPEPVFSPEHVTEVCAKQPNDITLADVAFVEDPGRRSAGLRRLAGQVGDKLDKAKLLVKQYGPSDELSALVATAQQYQVAVTQYESDAEQFGDSLGVATLAEEKYQVACLAVMT